MCVEPKACLFVHDLRRLKPSSPLDISNKQQPFGVSNKKVELELTLSPTFLYLDSFVLFRFTLWYSLYFSLLYRQARSTQLAIRKADNDESTLLVHSFHLVVKFIARYVSGFGQASWLGQASNEY